MNTNFAHNIMNVVVMLIGTLIAVDWSTFGLSPEMTGMVIAALGFIKLLMNAFRDGPANMASPQPAVIVKK